MKSQAQGNMKTKKNDTKRVFLKKGACSHTFFYILNREFGHLKDDAEKASDPLSGGLDQEGYQCGMLWGAALGAGAEAFRKYEDSSLATAQAVTATQSILESFIRRTGSANCAVITDCDFNSKFGLAKYLLSGKPIKCFMLADKWAPEAIESSKKGLSKALPELSDTPVSCASEVVKKMGGNLEESVMVAGFAGGMGLSGNACGALAAAIWMITLRKVKDDNYKFVMNDPETQKLKELFLEETDYKMECRKICGREFKTIGEHTEFINQGGCGRLIDLLGKM